MSVAPELPLPFTGCSIRFKIKDDLDFPHVLKDITLKAYHPQYGRVGELHARRIDRKSCRVRGDFHQIMDRSEYDEIPTFAMTLFDKRGKLKPEFTANEYHKGTGAFGHELDDGILLYVFVVRVQEEFHRRGVASHLLSALANSPHGAEAVSVLACPGPVERIEDHEAWVINKSIAANIFFKNSYRRIGRTCYVAYAINAQHPSRTIHMEEDVHDRRELISASTAPPLFCGLEGIHSNSDTDDDNDLQNSSSPSLHDAAYHSLLSVVRALLAQLPGDPRILNQLFSRDNADGLTPLESCEQRQRSLREEIELDTEQVWAGYTPHALRSIYLLKQAMGEDVGMSEDQYVSKYRYGCTCEQCIGGWLSLRMRYALSYLAEGNVDLINEGAEVCAIANLNVSPYDLPGYEHFPPAVQGAGILTSAFCIGYARVTGAIAITLKAAGTSCIPTADNIIPKLSGMATRFFNKGGRVEHALDYLLTTAAEEASDFYDAQVPRKRVPLRLPNQTDEEYASFCRLVEVWGPNYNWVDALMQDTAYIALPACENDLNFALVALQLGLHNPSRFLPPPPRPCNSLPDPDDSDSDSDPDLGSGTDSESENEDDEDEDHEDDDDDDDDDDDVDEQLEDDEHEDSVIAEEKDEDVKEPPRKRMRMYL